MKQISFKKELLLTLIAGIGFTILFYTGIFVAGWIGMLIILVSILFGFTALFIFFGLIFNSIRFKIYTKGRIINILIVGLSLFIVIFRPIESIIEKIKSPIVFGGFCEHTVTSVWILLRQDKTFEYNAGAFLNSEMYYGKYEIKDSLIVLRFDIYKNVNTIDTLVITNNGIKELNLNRNHHHVFRGNIDKIINR